MRSCFIVVRFDRMKNKDLRTLYYELTNDHLFPESPVVEIDSAYKRLKTIPELAENLMPKQRKQDYNKEITALRAAKDKLVAGLLFHAKALQYAVFDDHKPHLYACEVLRKELKPYVRTILGEKHSLELWLNARLNYNADFKIAITQLGLMPYIEKLAEINMDIASLLEKQKETQQGRPAPNTTIKAREKLIAGIRSYLQAVDAYTCLYPDADISALVNHINVVLKSARTQLRNTTTRRIRKTEREKSSPMESVEQDSLKS